MLWRSDQRRLLVHHTWSACRFVAGLPNLQDSNNLLGRPRRIATATSPATIRLSEEKTTVPTPAVATTSAATATGTAAAKSAATDTVASSLESEGRKGRDFLYNEGFVADSKFGKLMQGLGWTGRRANPKPNCESRRDGKKRERETAGEMERAP